MLGLRRQATGWHLDPCIPHTWPGFQIVVRDGSTTYRIHGTDAPWLIGQEVSHGCIRMFNEDVIDLYPRAQVGAKVIVTWKHFLA